MFVNPEQFNAFGDAAPTNVEMPVVVSLPRKRQ
jgi:hypothetical protein